MLLYTHSDMTPYEFPFAWQSNSGGTSTKWTFGTANLNAKLKKPVYMRRAPLGNETTANEL